MTEEEINKKAEKHCNEVLCNAHEKCNEVIKCRDWRSRRAGFFCGYEQALKDFEKENAELKADNDARKFAMAMSEKVEKQLREENAELKSENQKWKDEWQEQVQEASDEGYARTLQTIQLAKAKEIIKQLLLLPYANNEEVFADVTSILDKAEQFLSEVEK